MIEYLDTSGNSKDLNPTVCSNRFVNSLNKVVCNNRLAPTPFMHNIINHEVFSVHSAHSLMKICCTIPLCLQEIDNASQFGLGERITNIGYVYVTYGR